MNLAFTPSTELHRLFGLSTTQVQRVLSEALKTSRGKNAYCDIYFQHATSQHFSFDQGLLKGNDDSTLIGAGVRVVVGDKVGYSHTDHVNITNLLRCARKARAIVDFSHSGTVPLLSEKDKAHNLYPVKNTGIGLDADVKINILRQVDATARAVDSRIQNVSVSLSVDDETVIIATSFGDVLVDKRPLLHFSVSCQAEEGERKERGSSGGGGRIEFAQVMAESFWREHAQRAAEEAIDLLSAVHAPAGTMDVVMGPGWPGVLLHEAVGHPLEGDFNRKKTSAFSNLLGQMVASPLVTVIDDGTIFGRRGSLNIDDEGVATKRTVLIENGRLTGYMQDRMNATLMGAALTGNGRRENFSYMPMPRMTNTYMDNGPHSPEEIIASVKRGIYISSLAGGQVDITSGKFVFSASSAQLIENGKLTRSVKGATLIGNGPESLHRVTMVGNDLALDRGVGNCGKGGQTVPVGVGMPTVRINGVTVGGQS